MEGGGEKKSPQALTVKSRGNKNHRRISSLFKKKHNCNCRLRFMYFWILAEIYFKEKRFILGSVFHTGGLNVMGTVLFFSRHRLLIGFIVSERLL